MSSPAEITPATFVLTCDGAVSAWSNGAERLFGLRPGQAIGRDIRTLLGDRADGQVIDQALTAAAAHRSWHGVLHAETATVPDLAVVVEPLTTAAIDAAPCQVAVTAMPQRPGGMELVNEAGRLIGSTLDPHRTAEEIVDVAVPRFADSAAVYVLERALADERHPGQEADGSIVARRLAIGFAADDPKDWAGVFPVGQVVVLGPHTPYARCVGTAEAMVFGPSDAYEVVAERTGLRLRGLLDHTSVLVAPLTARGRTLGFVLLSRKRGRVPFTPLDRDIAAELGVMAAVRIDNARLYEREHRTVIALQHSLYPAHITVPPGLEIAHRYLPAGAAAHVGGDWYDVVPLPGDRVALVIGDAMGHGVTAAAAMGQLRVAAHTLAALNLSPSEILRRLDAIARDLDAAQFATCICVICDPATGRCSIAGAGHPPVLLAEPDGHSRVVRYAPGLPLGTGDAATGGGGDSDDGGGGGEGGDGEGGDGDGGFPVTEVTLPPGSTLVLYTDGLIESRSEDLDAGIAALQAALVPGPHSLEEVADRLLKGLRDRTGDDDVALMLVRPR